MNIILSITKYPIHNFELCENIYVSYVHPFSWFKGSKVINCVSLRNGNSLVSNFTFALWIFLFSIKASQLLTIEIHDLLPGHLPGKILCTLILWIPKSLKHWISCVIFPFERPDLKLSWFLAVLFLASLLFTLLPMLSTSKSPHLSFTFSRKCVYFHFYPFI